MPCCFGVIVDGADDYFLLCFCTLFLSGKWAIQERLNALLPLFILSFTEHQRCLRPSATKPNTAQITSFLCLTCKPPATRLSKGSLSASVRQHTLLTLSVLHAVMTCFCFCLCVHLNDFRLHPLIKADLWTPQGTTMRPWQWQRGVVQEPLLISWWRGRRASRSRIHTRR